MDAAEQAVTQHTKRANFLPLVLGHGREALHRCANSGKLEYHTTVAIDEALGRVQRAIADPEDMDVQQGVDKVANATRRLGCREPTALGGNQRIECNHAIGMPRILRQDNPCIISSLNMINAEHVWVGRSLE